MVNQKRDLRTGQSVWEANRPVVLNTDRPDLDRIHDVVIIGAGVSGSLAAEQISRQTSSVVVIDRRPPGSGSTSASTALIQWEIDQPLSKLSGIIGARNAGEAYRASRGGVQKLIRRIRQLNISCDLALRDTVLIAGDAMGKTALSTETRRRKRSGLPSTFLDEAALARQFGFQREGAIWSRGSCELDPLKLCRSLLKIAKTRGAKLLFPANVTDIDATPRGVLLGLDDGHVIAARKVIAATGYEVLPAIPSDEYNLVSTWALATKPVPAAQLWPRRALVWEASDPYLYFRATAGNRIVAGGEDAAFKDARRRDSLIAQKTGRVLAKLKRLLPGIDLEPEFRWAGTFAESPTGLPTIGAVKDRPNLFAILGSGGNGITFSAIASDMAARWAMGRSHPHENLFGLS